MASATARPQLNRRASFWTAAAVVVVALWTSGSPALVYPLYEGAWSLTPAVITLIFAVYPVTLVVVLLIFGSLSDYIGRRAAILLGLASMLVGVLTFALAQDVAWLFVGRAFQGIGVGLALAPAGAALVDFDRSGKRAGSINTLAIAVGLSLATIVGGTLVQYAPWPRELTFWALVVVIVGVGITAYFLPRAVRAAEASGRWRPTPIHVPKALRGIVITAALAITANFAVGSVMISLGAQMVRDVLHTDNTLIAGSVLALGTVVSGIVSLTLKRVPLRTAVGLGSLFSAVAVCGLIVSAATGSLAVFIAAGVAFGFSGGLSFLGALGMLNKYAPAKHRAGTQSIVYLIAYVGQGLTAVSLGLIATSAGLPTGLDIVGPALLVVSLAGTAAALVIREPKGEAVAEAEAVSEIDAAPKTRPTVTVTPEGA